MCTVFVVGFPFRDVGEKSPDLCAGDVFGDAFVGDEVVCCAGLEVVGPDDCRLGCHFGDDVSKNRGADKLFEVGNRLVYVLRIEFMVFTEQCS